MSSPLQELAHAHGVLTGYTDGLGDRRHPDDETLLSVLRSLAVAIDRPEQAAELLRQRRAEQAATAIEPVMVAWDGWLGRLPIRLPRQAAPVEAAVALRTEDGEETESGRVYREDDADVQILPHRPDCRRLVLPLDLRVPPGYHTLLVDVGSHRRTALVISAPRRCPTVKHPSWGVFLPLYALRHRRDWGIGDLGGLARLQRWLADLGGDYLQTLPLFASFLAESGPFEPSPYRPVSRLFWNEVYLDVEGLPEARTEAVCRLLEAHPVVVQREALQHRSHVDYRRVAHLKRQIVAECAAALGLSPRREAAFRAWLADDPARGAYARFRASCERHGPPVPHPASRGTADMDPDAVHYHAYAQWTMDQQLAALPEGGSRLALDLPLGVHPDGFDAWQRPEAFAAGVHLGAPPDALMPEGQDWNAPPLRPSASRASGHSYLISCLRTIMGRCGLVRLDHIMGLHRQFVVPAGRAPRSGTYVRLPAEELYALVSLEAQRSGTIVVGEDIGTVPRAVREAMTEHGVLRTYALQAAEVAVEQGPPPPPLSPGDDSLATLGTHDMPTFAAFWHDADLAGRGAGTPASARFISVERARRDGLRRSLHQVIDDGQQPSDSPIPSVQDALIAGVSLLAESPAPIVIVNLEDLWLETEPQNVPGSNHPSANWRRRARVPLEGLDSEAIVSVIAAIRNRRREARA